ncbi:MAG: hypothetical protein N2489_01620 [Clostridia bacterium]|nr:hypothetical protein [Clostridia bacterium]
MAWVILNVFLYLLAGYGAAALLMAIITSIRRRVCTENANVKLIVMVKNGEEVIEGIVRNIFLGDFLRKIMVCGKLTVLDMGSEDSTLEILKRLEKEYGDMEVLEKNQKNEVFTYFSKNNPLFPYDNM